MGPHHEMIGRLNKESGRHSKKKEEISLKDAVLAELSPCQIHTPKP